MDFSLPGHTWYVKYLQRSSARMLQNLLAAEVINTPTTTDRRPYRLSVEYRVGSNAWRSNESSGTSYHLRAPSMAVVLGMCGDVVTRQGILAPGQIVAVSGIKLIDPQKENVLIVSIAPIAADCAEDKPDLESKLLEWFIQKSEIEGREPTRSAFRRLLRNLKNKNSR